MPGKFGFLDFWILGGEKIMKNMRKSKLFIRKSKFLEGKQGLSAKNIGFPTEIFGFSIKI